MARILFDHGMEKRYHEFDDDDPMSTTAQRFLAANPFHLIRVFPSDQDEPIDDLMRPIFFDGDDELRRMKAFDVLLKGGAERFGFRGHEIGRVGFIITFPWTQISSCPLPKDLDDFGDKWLQNESHQFSFCIAVSMSERGGRTQKINEFWTDVIDRGKELVD